ncbi:hypothetical protein RRG08_064356 [Elysia crispata]|uniref:Uncharacterized protein n=1 Tax=Elysia crispata TaxID=231223 RepID=A0AAE0XTA1_9GAST|nr:hypothetical protein RRG08_064356 [Elysia crispata]
MNACNDLSPPEKIKKELNDEDSRVKQEVKQEFVSPSQSLMTSNTYTNFKDEKWSNIHEHGNMQNGFGNSSFKFTETITKSPYNNLLASIEMKKEHVPNYDQEGAREAKQELGP